MGRRRAPNQRQTTNCSVFNYDIPFVRGIISGPRNEVAKDFINEAIAQIVYSRIQVDASIETGYKNTYRNISRIKTKLFGGYGQEHTKGHV